jgi:XRE family transcriptional regulator, regulator of sulfur utilization
MPKPNARRTLLAGALLAAALLAAPRARAEDPVQGSFAITWDEIQAKPAGTSGMSRSVLRAPTATLDELEIHVTALPAGKTTHAPHTHANEEIIVVREGTLDAFQNGKTTRVGPGSLLFMGSNEPHNVTNVGATTAVYHVINWASPGMLRPRPASQEDGVRAFYADWQKAADTRGADGYAAFVAEDAVLLPPGEAPVSGKAAVRAWRERHPEEAAAAGSEDEVSVAGEVVLRRSTRKGERAAAPGAPARPFELKYFDVLRRKAGGGYELARRMWSSNLAP